MGVNKVIAKGQTIIDLTGDTVTPNVLASGFTAHNAAGDPIIGVGGGITNVDDDTGEGDTDVVWSANRGSSIVKNITGLVPITGWVNNKYINVSGTSVVRDENATYGYKETTSSIYLQYTVVECQPGDKFTINGEGGATASAKRWVFIDANDAILSPIANIGGKSVNEVIIAPEDAVKLILIKRAGINDSQTDTFIPYYDICFKGNNHVINNAKRKINMTEASIGSSGGLWASGIANFADDKSVATIHRYRSKGAKYIKITWIPLHSNELFSVFQYDISGNPTRKSYSCIEIGTPQTHTINLNSDTETLCFGCINNNGQGTPNKQIILETDGSDIEELKNPSFGSNIENTRWFRFGFKAYEYISNGTKKKAYTTGIMMLPPNYDPEGAPSPVILFCHGSSSYTNMSGTVDSGHNPFLEFLVDCGYAVIDCYGWTNRYPDVNAINRPSLWSIPTCCKTYVSLVNLMTDAFNLDKNNMFVLCKSLGGHIAAWLSTALPIKAACFLAPSIRMNLGSDSYVHREAIIEDLDLHGVIDSEFGWDTEEDCLEDFISNWGNNGWNSAKRERFYIANESKLIGVSPEFINVIGKTPEEKLAIAAYFQYDSTLTKMGCPPTKIWVAMDDENVSTNFILTYAQQIRNSGTFAEVRIMPNDTGKHHATDYDPQALKTLDVTTPLGYHYDSVATAYYEAWEFIEKYVS